MYDLIEKEAFPKINYNWVLLVVLVKYERK